MNGNRIIRCAILRNTQHNILIPLNKSRSYTQPNISSRPQDRSADNERVAGRTHKRERKFPVWCKGQGHRRAAGLSQGRRAAPSSGTGHNPPSNPYGWRVARVPKGCAGHSPVAGPRPSAGQACTGV